ncbi:hypothetical protein BH10PSE3_BH10PSE3_27030 [soil metagenome]
MDRKRILVLAIGAVVLLLLAIPIATVRIKIDLPPAAPASDKVRHTPIEVEILSDRALRVDGAPSTLETLPHDVAAKASSPPDEQEIRIRAGEDVSYAAFMAVLQRLKGVGWTKVGIIASDETTR